MTKQKDVVVTIKMSKFQYLGHVTRGDKYQLLQMMMQERLEIGAV